MDPGLSSPPPRGRGTGRCNKPCPAGSKTAATGKFRPCPRTRMDPGLSFPPPRGRGTGRCNKPCPSRLKNRRRWERFGRVPAQEWGSWAFPSPRLGCRATDAATSPALPAQKPPPRESSGRAPAQEWAPGPSFPSPRGAAPDAATSPAQLRGHGLRLSPRHVPPASSYPPRGAGPP